MWEAPLHVGMKKEHTGFGAWEISQLSLLNAIQQTWFFIYKMKMNNLFHKAIKWIQMLDAFNYYNLGRFSLFLVGDFYCLFTAYFACFATVEHSLCCLTYSPFSSNSPNSPGTHLREVIDLKLQAVFKLSGANCPKLLFSFFPVWLSLENLEEHSSIFSSLFLNLEPMLRC